MNEADLRFFEGLIQEKIDKIQKDLSHFGENVMSGTNTELSGDLSSYATHPSDQSSGTMEREHAFMLASKEGRFLHHLNEALERIKDGTFGRCRVCEKAIGRARLEAVPHATMCIACKSEEERTQRDRH
ncbi:MAG: TraR/DksA C4-type zinc finger protein [Candidatus Latescibacterota bacterium]